MSPGSEGAELQSLPHGKPSQEDPGSCAVLQHHPLERKGWHRLCGQREAAAKAALPADIQQHPGPLLQHLDPGDGCKTRLPLFQTLPRVNPDSSRSARSLGCDSCSHRGATLPKGKRTQIHPQGLLGDRHSQALPGKDSILRDALVLSGTKGSPKT